MYMYHIDTQVLLNHMSVSESTTESIDVVTQLSILDCLLVLSERLKKTLELSYYNILTNDMKDKITVSDDFHTPSSTPDLESLPCESLLLLFSRKLDITGFSELILSKVLKFLSTCIDTHLPWLNIEDNDTNDILINTLVGVVCVTMRLVISLCDLSMISVNEDEEESVRKVLYLHFNMFTCTCTPFNIYIYMYMYTWGYCHPFMYYLAADMHVHVHVTTSLL